MYTHERKKKTKKQNKKNKNKDFISEWPEYKQKKNTFKNESYSKIIIFKKLILQKINFAL